MKPVAAESVATAGDTCCTVLVAVVDVSKQVEIPARILPNRWVFALGRGNWGVADGGVRPFP